MTLVAISNYLDDRNVAILWPKGHHDDQDMTLRIIVDPHGSHVLTFAPIVGDHGNQIRASGSTNIGTTIMASYH